jgi:carboxyl-terminal processing protease
MRAPKKASLFLCIGGASLALLAWCGTRRSTVNSAVETASVPTTHPNDAGEISSLDDPPENTDPTFRCPSGEAPALTCDEARSIAAQVVEELAFDPPTVKPDAFASSTADWVDPHGFWAASSSSPPSSAITKNASALSREILTSHGECVAARDIGHSLEKWVDELRDRFDARLANPKAMTLAAAVSDPILDDATTPHAELATIDALADRLAEIRDALPSDGTPILKIARDRYFPRFDDDGWSRVVLAAAVRAYVPLVDPHGAWAPLDEESSVYAVDLDAHPPEPLWEKVVRTAAGVRIESGALEPLRDGDVVVELDHMTLAGLSLEQVDQLSIVAAESHSLVSARVLRDGEASLRAILIDATPKAASPDDARDDLQAHRVPYGDADVGVVAIREVRDDLGDALAHAVHELRKGSPPLAGLILDLRGNGGGSTEGASAALGMFIPNAELFPMKRRDGTIETEAAPEPPQNEAWDGPLATLVDGSTASAAEMIAGALAAYHRAPTIGHQTYGKGCAQEYEDDDPRTGVLRLTTLLYALPDGTAVQRVGLSPMLRIPFAPLPGEDDTTETEAKLEGAPPTWKGPDMRSMDLLEHNDRAFIMTWPAPTGAARKCDDADVCRALHALATPTKLSARRAPR